MMSSNKKQIIHIFSKSIFLRYYLDFLSKNYDNIEHEHIIITTYNDLHSNTVAYPNGINNKIIELSSPRHLSIRGLINYLHIWQLLRKSDLVICHSLSYYSIISLLINPLLLSKTVWVIWGYELYDYRTKNALPFIRKIFFTLKKLIVPRIPYVVARTPDYHLLKKWYKSHARNIPVEPLYGDVSISKAHRYIRDPFASCIKITLGNSATETNRHIDVLKQLSAYKNQNIILYIPLSYGDIEYAELVKNTATSIFGDKVVILDRFMSPDDYNQHLSEMDIGIFNNNRQQALGNIAYLLAAGVKIYLNIDSPLWDIFTEYKFIVHPMADLNDNNFEKFTAFDSTEQEYNARNAKELFSEQHCIDGWDTVFSLRNNPN